MNKKQSVILNPWYTHSETYSLTNYVHIIVGKGTK